MNWRLAGFELEYGSQRNTAPPSASAIAVAVKRARCVAKKYGVSFVSADTVKQWQAEKTEGTLFLFDVRQPEEFMGGHIPGSRNAQGGQLVQATDEYAAVRNAKYVLADDTEARAVITAHWLNQMGLPHVYVLRNGIGGSGYGVQGLARGSAFSRLPAAAVPDVPCISPIGLYRETASGMKPLVVDVGNSKMHRQGHIPGAVWVTRACLKLALEAYPAPPAIVITSDDETHVRFAVQDATALWRNTPVSALEGGNAAWRRAGLACENGMRQALCPEVDVWYKPYTDVCAGPEAMKNYFDWESGLVGRIRQDGSARFSLVL